jgi:poly(3-hydroxybutyrate) depolymerase
MPVPGKQVAQTIELPANTVIRPRQTDEERDAERARRNALTREQRNAEDTERRLQSFEEMRNPKPLSETETQMVDYLLFLPNDYETDTGQTFPLLLFLHGAGERGNEIEKVKTHGPPKLLSDPANAKDCPFIVVSPQCPENMSWSPLQLGLLLDKLEETYAIDKNRIYVTGLSMGGFGTWGLLYQFPERFAAAVPICGGFDPGAAKRFVDIPLWVFHGAKDSIVRVAMSTDVVEAIHAAGGKHVQLTVFPDLEHDSWTITYNNPALYRWLLEHNLDKRVKSNEITAHTSKLDAVYQEVGGHPILTILLTNIGQEPFSVMCPFDSFYVRIEVLDSQGENLTNALKTQGITGAYTTDSNTTLVLLKPQHGVHRRIDLYDGFTSIGIGHATMQDTMHHVPAMFTSDYNVSLDDVSRIHKIRVTLHRARSGPIFDFAFMARYFFGIDAEAENLFFGQRQVLEILLDENVVRTIPQFGQLMELGERVFPLSQSDEPFRIAPQVVLPPPVLPTPLTPL